MTLTFFIFVLYFALFGFVFVFVFVLFCFVFVLFCFVSFFLCFSSDMLFITDQLKSISIVQKHIVADYKREHLGVFKVIDVIVTQMQSLHDFKY